ncbi:uncharacterized protein ACO6RY_08135 [Pungitius sinensis]
MWLEKPEPLLESGHDLAVTHREEEEEEERGGGGTAQTLKKQPELWSPRSDVRRAPIGACRSLGEPRLLSVRAPRAVFTGGGGFQGAVPPAAQPPRALYI